MNKTGTTLLAGTMLIISSGANANQESEAQFPFLFCGIVKQMVDGIVSKTHGTPADGIEKIYSQINEMGCRIVGLIPPAAKMQLMTGTPCYKTPSGIEAFEIK